MKKKKEVDMSRAHDLVAEVIENQGLKKPAQTEVASQDKPQQPKQKQGGVPKKQKKLNMSRAHELVAEVMEKRDLKPVSQRAKKQQTANLAPNKLCVVVTVIDRKKCEYFLDLLQSFQCNFQLSLLAEGTARSALGVLAPNSEKAVIFSVMKKESSKIALDTLQRKFETIRGGKGIAFTIPMTSTIGVLIYRFLCNKE